MVIFGFAATCLACLAAVTVCSMLACLPPRHGSATRFGCAVPSGIYGRIMASLSKDGKVVRAALLCAAACQICTAAYTVAAIRVFAACNINGAFLTVCLPSLFVCLLEMMLFVAVRLLRVRRPSDSDSHSESEIPDKII